MGNPLTIPQTPAASLVNSSDLLWVWQAGALKSAQASLLSSLALPGFFKGNFTLAANAFSTIVNTGAALNCLLTSFVLPIETTADAAAMRASGSFYITYGVGFFTVNHGSNPSIVMTFNYLLVV